MKVGDYVRIHTLSGQGGMAKLEKIDDICITDNRAVEKNNIVKSSQNIIDLIEVGDYVNGKEVIDIQMKCDGNIKCLATIGYDITNEMINSIVTKEQFERMEYKINE